MIAKVIYILCAAMSLFCFGLLFRAFLRKRTRVLFACSASFLALALSNVLLVADFVVFPNVDLLLFRNSVTLIGVGLLLWALISST